MGELVTDEEIDAMISILDTNGDGQVNFQQFQMMGKSPNFGYESISVAENTGNVENNPSKESDYDMKRKVLSHFVRNNNIQRNIINDFRALLDQKRNAFLSNVVSDISSASIWEMDYPTFCRCLGVECTGESKKVFDLLKLPDQYSYPNEKIDVRQLLLGLINFIPTYSIHEKCQIMLELYDSRKQGFLTFDDLKEILAGNHLRAKSAVAKKAQTMMRFVDQANTGNLKLESLLDAATKFPNLLFPRHM